MNQEEKEALLKKLKYVFSINPQAKTINMTTDKQVFIVKNDAENHQRTLKKPVDQILTLSRSDFKKKIDSLENVKGGVSPLDDTASIQYEMNQEAKEELLKRLKYSFSTNPQESTINMTTDKQLFFAKNEADDHQRTLDKPIDQILTFSRSVFRNQIDNLK